MRYLILIFLLWFGVANAAPIGAPASSKRTSNISTKTSQIGGTNWVNFGAGRPTSTLNNSTAPDGANTATLLTVNSVSQVFLLNSPMASTLANNITYTASVFVKAGTNCCVAVGVSDQTTNEAWTLFTFSGTSFQNHAAGTGSIASHGFQAYPNGWYRVWVTFSFSSGASSELFTVDPWINTSKAATNTDTVSAWGSQLETGIYPSTYVPN